MTTISESASQSGRRFDFGTLLNRFGTLGIFVALVVVASLWSPSFLTQSNILNVLRQVASSAGVMAVGMLFVILTRGIDLSVGSVAALGCVLTAYFIAFSGYSVPTTILLVILILMLVGAMPTWPHSRNWGYGPSGGLGTVLVILLILYLLHVI